MRYLFIHPVFPGQFHKLMVELAANPEHEVWHLSQQSALAGIAGVRTFQYKFEDGKSPPSHPFLDKFSTALQHGDAVTKALLALKAKGLVPDIVCCYAGWGHGLYLKDIFPDTPIVGYFEWFLNAYGSEYNFDPAYPLAFENQRLLRITNAGSLLDLQSFDLGITPMHWQRRQFPSEFQHKLHCIHDGVDIDLFIPAQHAELQLPDGITLAPDTTEIVTYCTRGMEPFRGFPQFMRALVQVQKAKPACHVIIAGSDHNFYSRKLADGKSYKELMLEELAGQLDWSRIHFTGWLQPETYLKVLQCSDAHVYLTYPYVLSWSLLEAMSTGCFIIGSATPPVQEVISHRKTGLLVDFFDHAELAEAIVEGLDSKGKASGSELRSNARQKILDEYDCKKVIPLHLELLNRTYSKQ